MANRIYYASQSVQLRPQNDGTVDSSNLFDSWYQPLGVQSASMTTNFALEQTFQLGTVEIYDNTESIPEIEVTINKVIDNSAPLYMMCMGGKGGISGADNQDLVALSKNRVHFRLGIYNDNTQFVSGQASQHVLCSGMYLSSFNYTFPVDGNATEEVTLVGNHKEWNVGTFGGEPHSFTSSTIFDPDSTFSDGTNNISTTSTSSITRRHMVSIDQSSLPYGKGGIADGSHIQNISVSCDLGRETINELGKFSPYCRYTTFPIEVTSEFEVVSTQGDKMDANDFRNSVFCGDTKPKNLENKTISIYICDSNTSNNNNYMILNLGNKNTLTSVNHSGGDTGGGNVSVTYSFRNFNNFSINANGSYLAAPTAPNS